jgi:hypothetical protein
MVNGAIVTEPITVPVQIETVLHLTLFSKPVLLPAGWIAIDINVRVSLTSTQQKVELGFVFVPFAMNWPFDAVTSQLIASCSGTRSSWVPHHALEPMLSAMCCASARYSV